MEANSTAATPVIWRIGLAAIALLIAYSFSPHHPAQAAELRPSGTVTINQSQVAFIVSGNLGGGELTYAGRTYRFEVAGLGIGGFGVSTMEATGTVYNLDRLDDFEGLYGQARVGLVVADASAGKLWLENAAGVVIELEAKRKGLALSLGADAVSIDLD